MPSVSGRRVSGKGTLGATLAYCLPSPTMHIKYPLEIQELDKFYLTTIDFCDIILSNTASSNIVWLKEV
jgi:hypothetical protein